MIFRVVGGGGDEDADGVKVSGIRRYVYRPAGIYRVFLGGGDAADQTYLLFLCRIPWSFSDNRKIFPLC